MRRTEWRWQKGAAGTVLVVADQETKETLGVHILGEGAPEMIAAAAIAVTNKMTLPQWEELIIAHPSFLKCCGKPL